MAGLGALLGSAAKDAANSVLGGINSGLSAATSSLFGGIGFNAQRKRQQKLNEDALAAQYKYQELMAGNNFQRQMAMYERTYEDNSPANRVKQLREAGLSPALMYSGGAQAGGGAGQLGGGTTGNAGSIHAGDAAQMMAASTQRAALGLDFAMKQAQIENIKADTEEKRSGVPINESSAAKNWSDIKVNEEIIKNKRIEGRLNTAIADGIEIENMIKEATSQDQIEQAAIETKKNAETLKGIILQNYKMTKDNEIIEELNRTNLNLLKGQLRLTELQAEKLGLDIDMAPAYLAIEQTKVDNLSKQIPIMERQAKIAEDNAQTNRDKTGIDAVLGSLGIIGDVVLLIAKYLK